jgi:hypothetical protein
MYLTNKSQKLISFFIKNNCISNIKAQSIVGLKEIKQLYSEILNSYKYLLNLKQTNLKFYNFQIKKINNVIDISKPKNFNYNSFPNEARKHIDLYSLYEISYTFSLFNRDIKLIFIDENENIENKIHIFNGYVDNIIMWLYILNENASKKCSSKLTVYFYFTSFEKKLPKTNIDILDQEHINTAFTTTCPINSEIVVFRKEEWFKVFLHETFHNFGLDFSDMNNTSCHEYILSLFPVKSDVNLYEAYTEFWAEIINALFCSFHSLKNKNNMEGFIKNSEIFINLERTYSLFQLIKVLKFMDLPNGYRDLYLNNKKSIIARDNLYKENTNVLSYYVIKTVLILNYQSFLNWCGTNNFNILQFKKTAVNQKEFCNYISKNYKTKYLLDNIDRAEECYNKFIKQSKKNNNLKYLLTNLRMSICELG